MIHITGPGKLVELKKVNKITGHKQFRIRAKVLGTDEYPEIYIGQWPGCPKNHINGAIREDEIEKFAGICGGRRDVS